MDDTVWVSTVFTKNRERLIAHDAVIALFNEVLAIAQPERLALRRALQCGRHTYPSLGWPQELRAQSRQQR